MHRLSLFQSDSSTEVRYKIDLNIQIVKDDKRIFFQLKAGEGASGTFDHKCEFRFCEDKPPRVLDGAYGCEDALKVIESTLNEVLVLPSLLVYEFNIEIKCPGMDTLIRNNKYIDIATAKEFFNFWKDQIINMSSPQPASSVFNLWNRI